MLPRREGCGLSDLVSAGLPSVAIRVPAHPVAQAILRAAACPVAAPSANPSGRVSPTRADHVAESLGDAVAMIVDGGPCAVGVESTVLDMTGAAPHVLRPGGVTAEAVSAALGVAVDFAPPPAPDGPLLSPGQMTSHYAPGLPVRLNAAVAEPGEALLGFGRVAGAALNLSPAGDVVEAAANLFAMLRALDGGPYRGIAVSPIPDAGLGVAINDRLMRAAAPRP